MNKGMLSYLITIISHLTNRLVDCVIRSLDDIIQFLFKLKSKALNFWRLLSLTSLLLIILAQFNIAPVRSQIINLPETLQKQPSLDTTHLGNLDVAKIRLDGKVLFSVATPTSNVSDSQTSTSAIQRRVKTIEFHLSDIVKRGFDPDTLTVTKSLLNNQTILVASDKDWGPRNILTVTAFDVELDEPGTIDQIAQSWAKIIEEALLQAQKQRQPAYQKEQIPLVLAILGTMVLVSFGIRILQKFRGKLSQRLERLQDKLEAINSHSSEPPPSSKPMEQTAQKEYKYGRRRFFPQLTLDQQISVNLILRRVLIATQIVIWFGGIAIIFDRFPQTRAWGEWLLRVPLAYIGIPLGMAVLKSFVDALLRSYLKGKVNHIKERGNGDVRLRSRALSILSVLKELTGYLALAIGFLLFFYIIKAFNIALIAIALIAFVSKNTLQDFLQTYFILAEDQYALGDYIQIGEVNGKVEKISLRSSQVRSRCGDLFTIPHASFDEIKNFSHGYSGINLWIDVAYQTDLDQAIKLIEQVAKEMEKDSVWGQYMIASEIKGVENFGDNSITIGLVLKTDAGEQWSIGREYRRRLKRALDQAGISIPFPQRSIWFENPLMTDGKMRSK